MFCAIAHIVSTFSHNEMLERSLVTPSTTVEPSSASKVNRRSTSLTDKRPDEHNYNISVSKIELGEACNQRRGVGP